MSGEMKIYIPNHCKIYYDDGSHHEKCKIPVKEAVEIMTNDWFRERNFCTQTLVGMRNCLTAMESAMQEFIDSEERCCKSYQQAELAENTAIKFKKLMGEK